MTSPPLYYMPQITYIYIAFAADNIMKEKEPQRYSPATSWKIQIRASKKGAYQYVLLETQGKSILQFAHTHLILTVENGNNIM